MRVLFLTIMNFDLDLAVPTGIESFPLNQAILVLQGIFLLHLLADLLLKAELSSIIFLPAEICVIPC